MKIKDIVSYVGFDVETTGLDPNRDKVLEYGCLRVSNNQIVGELRLLVNHGVEIPAEATAIHGITKAMIDKDGIKPEDACRKVTEFLGDDIVLGLNNVPFDYPFLEKQANKFGIKRPQISKWVDAGLLWKGIQIGMHYNQEEEFYRYAFRVKDIRAKGVKYNLNYLVKTFEIENLREDGLHGALIDLRMTSHVFEKIKEKYFAS
jgi:DNA polymerase III epsilon subunit-like protein